MANPTAGDAKKPYSSPILTVYGTVRELTQSTGTHGNPDGSIAPRAGTHI
jgi:hypothetical protein